MENPSEKVLVIGDDVWNRVVQIVQEAMLTATDCTDLLRQVRVSSNGTIVSLTAEYRKVISDNYTKMVAELEASRAKQKPGVIIGG